MVVITKLLQSLIPLGVVLNIVPILANPNALPELETTNANTALQARNKAVVEQVNKDEAILPQGIKFTSADRDQAKLGTKASNVLPVLNDQTCQKHLPAPATVARLLKTNVGGFYLPLEVAGKFDPFSEADCLAACVRKPE
ncbi:hypothetical protein NliqN6_4576 [Naganishia liquefaciens]|uniref:Uncharacterized protein n=1 Tax=Naganishia liquefaciens TaxID=104408 RepID=A0A8H3TXV9_9TREE|nr:hypothetical protein NliqN6_4576 [Naganishia liquefaciens]